MPASRAIRSGTIRLGRTIGPVYYATYDYISMHNHDTGTSSDALLAGTVFGNQGFMNNTFWYTSPKFGGYHHRLRLLAARRAAHGPERRAAAPHRPRRLVRRRAVALALSYANTKNDSDLDPGAGIQASQRHGGHLRRRV